MSFFQCCAVDPSSIGGLLSLSFSPLCCTSPLLSGCKRRLTPERCLLFVHMSCPLLGHSARSRLGHFSAVPTTPPFRYQGPCFLAPLPKAIVLFPCPKPFNLFCRGNAVLASFAMLYWDKTFFFLSLVSLA